MRRVAAVVGEHKVQVTELALRDWTEDFLNRLKALIAGEDGGGGQVQHRVLAPRAHVQCPTLTLWKQVVDYDHKYSVVAVDCTVELAPEFPSLSSGEGKEEALEKVKAMLGLQRNHSLRNMYAFDPSGKIKLYGTPTEMVQDYLEIRLKLYHRRKRRDVCRMRSNALRLANQVGARLRYMSVSSCSASDASQRISLSLVPPLLVTLSARINLHAHSPTLFLPLHLLLAFLNRNALAVCRSGSWTWCRTGAYRSRKARARWTGSGSRRKQS